MAEKCAKTTRRVRALFLASAGSYSQEQSELFGDLFERLINTIELRAVADVGARIALAKLAPVSQARLPSFAISRTVAPPFSERQPQARFAKALEETLLALAELAYTVADAEPPQRPHPSPMQLANLAWETVKAVLDCRFSRSDSAEDELLFLLTAEEAARLLKFWTVWSIARLSKAH